MNRIFVTGDKHGDIDFTTLSSKHFPEGKELTKDDYVIVLGDFGILWSNVPDNKERYLTKWYNEKPWTTLFVDGNHENHWRIANLKTEEKFGADVGKVTDSIYHLRRGRVYVIGGKKFFCFGGAFSIDKASRFPGISWWPEEVASQVEMDEGLTRLGKHDNKVDYILAHTCPDKFLNVLGLPGLRGKFNDPTCKYLSHVALITEFKRMYCGHFHINTSAEYLTCLYGQTEEIL